MRKKAFLREVATAISLLSILTVLAVVNTLLSARGIEHLISQIDTLDEHSPSEAELKEVEENFDRLGFFISITVNHDEIDEAEGELSEMIAAIREGDETAAKIAKSRLVGALRRLRRLSGAGINSII